jgi:hypothetical protein
MSAEHRLPVSHGGDSLWRACCFWRLADNRENSVTSQQHHAAFTLAELLVTVGVLCLLVFLATQLLNSAATVTKLGNKQMDADSEARQLLDRIALDFAQMVKRSDVDYYLKSPGNPQTGNDQITFYTALPGYFGTTPAPAPT